MESLAFLHKVRSLVIRAMFSDDDLMEHLVLKGGNLLDIVYGISARSSIDIDFSIDGEFDDIEFLRVKATRVLTSTFAEIGCVAFDVHVTEEPNCLSEDMRSFWGGYKIRFKIIEQTKFAKFKDDLESLRRNAVGLGKKGSTRFTIDISKHEYCEAKRPYDFDGYTIFVYPPEMVVCEKLRAICQQMPAYLQLVRGHGCARARDFIDIYTVCEKTGIDFCRTDFKDSLQQTFRIKKVPLSLLGQIEQHREYHAQDFTAVQATVYVSQELKAFDFYFDYVVRKCRQLESLWNV